MLLTKRNVVVDVHQGTRPDLIPDDGGLAENQPDEIDQTANKCSAANSQNGDTEIQKRQMTHVHLYSASIVEWLLYYLLSYSFFKMVPAKQ